mmetsp:Transcript_23544/g.76610  ORF Transcript_23544/g.76610 Transcript_23544/m.76610 type:complete len:443 (+) Transcript_23544:2237-3565(+)
MQHLDRARRSLVMDNLNHVALLRGEAPQRASRLLLARGRPGVQLLAEGLDRALLRHLRLEMLVDDAQAPERSRSLLLGERRAGGQEFGERPHRTRAGDGHLDRLGNGGEAPQRSRSLLFPLHRSHLEQGNDSRGDRCRRLHGHCILTSERAKHRGILRGASAVHILGRLGEEHRERSRHARAEHRGERLERPRLDEHHPRAVRKGANRLESHTLRLLRAVVQQLHERRLTRRRALRVHPLLERVRLGVSSNRSAGSRSRARSRLASAGEGHDRRSCVSVNEFSAAAAFLRAERRGALLEALPPVLRLVPRLHDTLDVKDIVAKLLEHSLELAVRVHRASGVHKAPHCEHLRDALAFCQSLRHPRVVDRASSHEGHERLERQRPRIFTRAAERVDENLHTASVHEGLLVRLGLREKLDALRCGALGGGCTETQQLQNIVRRTG